MDPDNLDKMADSTDPQVEPSTPLVNNQAPSIEVESEELESPTPVAEDGVQGQDYATEQSVNVVDDSTSGMEEPESGLDDSVQAQVSDGTEENESALQEQVKQLVHDILEDSEVSKPSELEVEDLSELEKNIQGLLLECLNEIKYDMPREESKGFQIEDSVNEDDVNEWLLDTISSLPGTCAQEPKCSDKASLTNDIKSWFDNTNMWQTDSNRELLVDVDKSSSTEMTEKEIQVTNLEEKGKCRFKIDMPEKRYGPYIPKFRKGPASSGANSSYQCKDDNTVTVKFIMPDGTPVYTQAYQLYKNISEIRYNLAGVFSIPPESIQLFRDDTELERSLPLAGLGIEPFGSVELVLVAEEPHKLLPVPVPQEDVVQVPDVINVVVHLDQDEYKEVVVEIWKDIMPKPWVGGFRDKKTGLEYHHAFSQTHPRVPKVRPEDTNHRDTQTHEWSVKYQNTPADKATQMSRRDHYIPCIHDKILSAKKYKTFAELEAERDMLRKVITIQRYLRGWLVRRLMKEKSDEYRRRLAWEAEQQRKEEEARLHEVRHRALSHIYPHTRADFETLYHMVERWRLAEVARITSLKTEAPRKAELCYLLEKEIVLLNSIESHRIKLKKEKLAKKEFDFIEKCSKPIEWTGYMGKTISMDTVKTQRARELKNLYISLCNQKLTMEERVNLLVSLKHALQNYSSNTMATETIRLMERECECLVRGLKDSDIDILRKRIKKQFFDLMKDPAFNPEAAKYSEEFNPGSTKSNMFKCVRCNIFMPHTKFVKATKSRKMNQCISCSWMDNIARPRADLGPYRAIMTRLRQDEEKMCCYSSIAFVMQDDDFHYLIKNIWHAHSAINECSDLVQLRLCRWKAVKEWSPWNCILLTKQEAKAHTVLKDLEKTYDSEFLLRVMSKHHLGRIHFTRLAQLDQRFRESGRWLKPDLNIKYVAPSPEVDGYQ